MHFRHPSYPTDDELRAWAADDDPVPPVQDWDLILCWRMDPGLLRLCVELAANAGAKASSFFLLVLYRFVVVVANDSQFDIKRSTYDSWLEVARGAKHPAVKRWRHEARLVLQGLKPFDRDNWWELWSQDNIESE
jgi:hypothetical protein